MKIITLILLFVTSVSFAQKIVYERSANIENQLKGETNPKIRKMRAANMSKPTYFNLYHKDNKTLYKKQSQEETEALQEELGLTNTNSMMKVMNVGEDGGLFQDFSTMELIRDTDIFGKPFLIKDKVQDFDWKLSDETKMIGEFECKKATTTDENEGKITAWYVESIPLPIGPYYYNGLPGLIVELNTEKLNFKALNIENIKGDIEIKAPESSADVITLKEYNRILKEKIDSFKNGTISL